MTTTKPLQTLNTHTMNKLTKLLEGIILLDKRVLNHFVWTREDYFRAWVTLLLIANDRNREVRLLRGTVQALRGQVVRSKTSLQKLLGRGRKWLSAFINECVEHQMIQVEYKPDYMLITVLNYRAYNDCLLELPGAGFSGTDTARGTVAGPRPDAIDTRQPVRDSADTFDYSDFIKIDGEVNELQQFCYSFKDPARGITKITLAFALDWQSKKCPYCDCMFPKDWKVALPAAFLEAHAKGDPRTKLSPNGREEYEIKDLIDAEMDKPEAHDGPRLASLLAELLEFSGKGSFDEYIPELFEQGRLVVRAN